VHCIQTRHTPRVVRCGGTVGVPDSRVVGHSLLLGGWFGTGLAHRRAGVCRFSWPETHVMEDHMNIGVNGSGTVAQRLWGPASSARPPDHDGALAGSGQAGGMGRGTSAGAAGKPEEAAAFAERGGVGGEGERCLGPWCGCHWRGGPGSGKWSSMRFQPHRGACRRERAVAILYDPGSGSTAWEELQQECPGAPIRQGLCNSVGSVNMVKPAVFSR